MCIRKSITALLLLLCLLVSGSVFAQRSYFDTSEHDLFECGEKFFYEKDFSAADRYFENFIKGCPDEQGEKMRLARMYIAFSSFFLRQEDAKVKLEQYIKKYPYTQDVEVAELYIGILEIEDGRYSQAVKRFEKISSSDLSQEQRMQLLYYSGYGYINTSKWKDALYEFDELLKIADSDEYKIPAYYYHGFANYNLGNYQAAINSLENVKDNAEFPNAKYLICLCYYADGNCTALLANGQELLKSNNTAGRNEILRLMGICSFKGEDYAAASDYMQRYQAAVKKMTREDWYISGMSYYKTGQWKDAVAYLSKAVSKTDDDISQNSYFHIGNAYMEMGDRQNARLAYESASKYKRSETLREDALYNYAVLTYLSGNAHFNESLSVFERFLSEFPNSKYREKVYECLVNIYLTTNNYSAAYNSIQKIKTESPIIKEAEERILYGMATNSIANRQYAPAAKNLKKIVEAKRNYNADILRKSMFWYAECLYKGNNYDLAISYYKEYLEKKGAKKDAEYNMAYYGLGYAYIRKGEYTAAAENLNRFCSQQGKEDKLLLIDAYNRIGDCYFYNRDYAKAAKAYTSSYNMGTEYAGTDYALYRLGMIAGLQKNYDKKISIMRDLLSKYPKSDLEDDALFEVARAYVEKGYIENAIQVYDEICGKYKRSNPIVRKARLQIAMLQYNAGNLDAAVESFKYVVQTYPRSEEAATALSTLEIIMVDNNRVAEYNEIAKKAGKTSSAKEDSLSYKACERIYFKDDFAGAAKNFEKYLQNYPEGRYANLARYYLANCLYRMGNNEASLVQYTLLADDPANPNMELTLRRAADLSFDKKDYKSAYSYYSQLKEEGGQDSKQYAKTGMLRSAYLSQSYEATIQIADVVIAENSKSSEIVPEARYKRMKSYIALGQKDKALPDIEELSKDSRSEYGAEAKYLLAQHFYDIKNYAMAEKEFFDFVESGTSHAYWMARAFLLIADVYMAQDNYFEARQYLQSLRDNYEGTEADISEGLNKRMELIEKHEKESVSE